LLNFDVGKVIVHDRILPIQDRIRTSQVRRIAPACTAHSRRRTAHEKTADALRAVIVGQSTTPRCIDDNNVVAFGTSIMRGWIHVGSPSRRVQRATRRKYDPYCCRPCRRLLRPAFALTAVKTAQGRPPHFPEVSPCPYLSIEKPWPRSASKPTWTREPSPAISSPSERCPTSRQPLFGEHCAR
jgi:hypothetical protein